VIGQADFYSHRCDDGTGGGDVTAVLCKGVRQRQLVQSYAGRPGIHAPTASEPDDRRAVRADCDRQDDRHAGDHGYRARHPGLGQRDRGRPGKVIVDRGKLIVAGL
jgi:hypothetical protein